jgi:hypothetical protein
MCTKALPSESYQKRAYGNGVGLLSRQALLRELTFIQIFDLLVDAYTDSITRYFSSSTNERNGAS